MKTEEEKINPQHRKVRGVLRFLGPIALVIGGLLMITAFVDFFTSGGPPKLFFLFFIAMPLLFAGFVMTSLGFMGAVSRYQAGEVAPVAKDTVNYLGKETTEGVGAIATAVGSGLRQAAKGKGGGVTCPKCDTRNDPDAAFCDNCGTPLARDCPSCGCPNDHSARFCDQCGAEMPGA